jgi:hypothetical protein
MSDRFSCHDKNSLIAYLYDEVEPPLRRQIDEHLRSCRECTDELGSLSEVRVGLSMWAPPEPELGITIARSDARRDSSLSDTSLSNTSLSNTSLSNTAARRSHWWSDLPLWAQAAAAVLVLALGLGVANVQVRSSSDGFVVTTGWMAPSSAAADTASPASDERWRSALVALESQLRGEIQANRSQAIVPASASPRSSDESTLKEVQAMLAASEQRQRQELALRLTQLTRDLDVQRRADLVRISQGFGQFEGRTGEMMARQRQMMNYVMRVSGQPQQ